MKKPAFLAGLLLLIATCLHAGQPADTARFQALLRHARSYAQTNIDSVGYFARTARVLAESEHNRKEEADAGNDLGMYYSRMGEFPTAIRYYQEAIGIYDSLKLRSDRAWATLGLAQLYKELSGPNGTEKFIDQGIQFSDTAYSFYASVKDTTGMIHCLNEQGIFFRDKAGSSGKKSYYDTAFARFTKALRLNAPTGQGARVMGKLYNNISQVYLEYYNEPRAALVYLARAVAFNEAAHNRSSLTYNYNNIAQVFIRLGQVDSALVFARRMLAVSKELKLPSRIFESYKELYLSYNAGKHPDSALHYYILASTLNDSLTNLAKTREVLGLQEKYNSIKKELAIRGLHAENVTKSRTIWWLALLSAFLIALAGVCGYLIHRLRQQKRQIGIQSQKLEVMLRELHHRVKNNLQIVSALLGLQRYKSEDAGTIGVLQESQQRVQAMSLIHQRLYKNDALQTVNIRDYLIDLAESLLSSYGYDKDRFDLQIDVCTEVLDIDQALPIGLIVNELVTNAFKYAYTGIGMPALWITLEQDSRDIVLQVRDNGVGINKEQWKKGKESFGKQLIGALCRQLRATQEMMAGEGTAFVIRIPRTAA